MGGKYDRGKRVDGVWVFGGVEKETGKCFLIVVKDRSATTLLEVIKDWIIAGSTIISDCWKAYDKLDLNFKDPESGVHTNQIEGLWNLAKKSFPSTNGSKKIFSGYLASFMLRSKWKGKDGFKLFFNHAAKILFW
ncbi:Uncharacterized protein APZ42_013450 [Daphnia magna]|uniref:ISXO2-like transposase domain-containing protein n=1 Tax=Daphnia magna TaxID=35525 RepID=A0A162QVE5_9CRUS|nr:Uncharacterized protein APZ42_013450 [Daphnia magna]